MGPGLSGWGDVGSRASPFKQRKCLQGNLYYGTERWRAVALDRDEWRRIVEKGKVPRGLWRQEGHCSPPHPTTEHNSQRSLQSSCVPSQRVVRQYQLPSSSLSQRVDYDRESTLLRSTKTEQGGCIANLLSRISQLGQWNTRDAAAGRVLEVVIMRSQDGEPISQDEMQLIHRLLIVEIALKFWRVPPTASRSSNPSQEDTMRSRYHYAPALSTPLISNGRCQHHFSSRSLNFQSPPQYLNRDRHQLHRGIQV
ncbi:unnamed protein product [Nezara viridula]|uniref:Uncharacterized protein n=1 Tax=Nezara viridula TaxID=85310 RepID=A0A9P0EBE6_NEZVI|nr:unnamed protein product [Nezara viridula]